MAAQAAGPSKGSAKRWSLGCVNAEAKARQKWLARVVMKFTKPGDCLLVEPCKVVAGATVTLSRRYIAAVATPSSLSQGATEY